MKTTKSTISMELTDRLAAKLADHMIAAQFRTAVWLNRKFNACSARGKKRIIMCCGLLTAIILLAGVFTSSCRIPGLAQNYRPVHIGQPSDLPKPPFTQRQLTDSLTKKK